MGKRDPDSWFMHGVYRREFRQDHGGGPEVPPHRKKGKPKKKYVRKGCPGNDGKAHVNVTWTELVEKKVPSYSYSGGEIYLRGWNKLKYHLTMTQCAGCGKVKNEYYDWHEFYNNKVFIPAD